MGSIATVFGIGKSPAEKARKRADRAAQARADVLAQEDAAKAKEEAAAKAAGEAEAIEGTAARKLALITTSSQGVLSDAATGRKKLLGN